MMLLGAWLICAGLVAVAVGHTTRRGSGDAEPMLGRWYEELGPPIPPERTDEA